MDFAESDNFNAEIIAEEQAHLAETLELIREQISLLENDGFSYRTIDIYDINEIERYEDELTRHGERKKEIKILNRALTTPYFARMRLKPIERVAEDDLPSMTKARKLYIDDLPTDEISDIYVGANIIIYKDRIIVYSHNSPIGNKVYERFEDGKITCGGYVYEVIFRRRFDIRDGVLVACFQDYSKETGGIVYDKFLAHMLKVKRGDKRLTDIIPTIQANQNEIITRPQDENCIVSGCAGCGKTMILLQRLEYLSFNKKLNLDQAVVIAPSEKYIEHIQPVVDDLMINAARRMTMGEFYKTLILSLKGIRASDRRAISDCVPCGDEDLSDEVVSAVYGNDIKRKLITALSPVKKSYAAAMNRYREETEKYERDSVWNPGLVKPKPPTVSVSLDRFGFLPCLRAGFCKAKLYLLLTSYCFVLGKPDFVGTLFIDEGQDYFVNEYVLLAEITKSTFDIYGDPNQQISSWRGVGDFNKLDGLRPFSKYALNENYRNSSEITAFVNELLGMNVTSLGLSGGKVRRARIEDIAEELSNGTDDRIAVIYSPSDGGAYNRLKNSLHENVPITVSQCKGMEYERVYVCGKLSNTEKYVAYTRALNELVICD
ncbi:MAG: AAA family ATPase [Clostridiales bacterium]|nr:AAA family ATPase [Clostridiales bacterium]